MSHSRKIVFLITILLIAIAQSLSAEMAASISGMVKDPQGKSVAGAVVTIIDRGGSARANTTTDSDGTYRFDLLQAGEYLVQAEAQGFARYLAENVHVERSSRLSLNISLQLAGVRQMVVVTASGTPQTSDEVSKSVTVIDRQQIDQRGDFAISEILRPTPGLRVQQLGGPGAFTAIRLRGLRNQDTAVLVDGLRFRDASATQADASGLLEDLMVTNIDHVEILRGSGSSLYGTNAIGGAINILTDEGGGRTRGNILFEGGSMGLFRGRTQLSGGLKNNRVQYSAGFAHLNVTNGLDGDSPARNTSGQGRMSLRLSPSTQLVMRLYGADSFVKLASSPNSVGTLPATGIVNAVPLTTSQIHLYETGTPVSQLSVGNATLIPSTDDPDNTRASRFLSGAMILSGHPAQSLTYTLSYQGLATMGVFKNGPAGVGYQPIGNTRSDFNGRIQTVNAHLDYQLAQSNTWNGGYEFETEKFGQISLDRLNPAAESTSDVTQRSNTLFIQDQQRLFGDRLQLSGAFRAQTFSLQHPQFTPITSAPYSNATFTSPPTAFTADGSAAYFLRRSGTKIRAHIGRGYRAPSLFERFGTGFDADFGYSVYGDPRLQPERSIAADAGIDQDFFHQRLHTSATYFYTHLQNVIVFDFSGAIDFKTDPFGRFGGYRNTNGGLARGIELSALVSVSRSLELSLAYTYTNAIERTPVVEDVLRSFLSPSQQFSTVITQRIGRRLFVTFNLAASSDYLAPIFGGTSRAYRFAGIKKAGLTASYRIPLSEFKALRFFAKTDNLFNQTYYESGFRTPGITALSGLQFEF